MKARKLILLLLIVGLVAASSAVHGSQYDFGGETVKLSFRFWGLTPLGPRRTYDWYNPDPRLQEHIESVEKMFNVKIEFVGPYGEGNVANVLRTGVMAGDVPFDVAHARALEYVPLALDGFLMPLDDFIEPEYYDTLPPELQPGDMYKVHGTTFVFPAMTELWSSSAGLTVNKTLLEREGLPMPYELFEQGLWTWDVLAEYARLLTKDTNGDGQVDQWGLAIDEERFGGFPPLVWMANNGAEFVKYENGRVVLDLVTDEVIETLEFLQGLYAEGVMRTTMDSMTTAFNVDTTHFIQFSSLAANLNNYDMEWGIMPMPTGPSAQGPVATERGNLWGGIIPITVQHDPRALVELVGALMQIKEPYIEDMEAWRERFWDNRAVAVYDRESLEMWKWQDTNLQTIPDVMVRMVLKDAGIISAMVNDVIIGGESPASVLSALQPEAQALLDDLLRQ